MPLSADELDALRGYISTNAGGYLRNIIREPYVTCMVCGTPVDGYTRCFACQQVAGIVGLADRVRSITYAISGSQSAHLMRGYKAHPPSQQHQALVALLTAIAVDGHTSCLNRLAGRPVSHWASVPSLPPKLGEHPLRRLVKGFIHFDEVPMTAATGITSPRSVSGSHFTTSTRLPPDAHVLVVDDTWTRGGHAQSTAITLRSAGAVEVSVLTVARWIEPTFGDNKQFITDRLAIDFDPGECPWTAGPCP